MGLAEQATPSKGGMNLKEAMAKIKKQHDIEESLKPKPEAKLVPNFANVGEGLVGKKPMPKKPQQPDPSENAPKTMREIMAAIKKENK